MNTIHNVSKHANLVSFYHKKHPHQLTIGDQQLFE